MLIHYSVESVAMCLVSMLENADTYSTELHFTINILPAVGKKGPWVSPTLEHVLRQKDCPGVHCNLRAIPEESRRGGNEDAAGVLS